jgi:hypothetical protein
MTTAQQLMFALAIVVPFLGAFYFVHQIKGHKQPMWQNYGFLTSLIFLISLMFLVGSGSVQSFNVEGNSVEIVNQKLDQVKALTELNKSLAKQTVELVNKVSSGTIDSEGYHSEDALQIETNLLKTAGYSDSEIEKIIGLSKH